MKFKKSATVLCASALVALAGPAMAVPSLVVVDGDSSNTDHAYTATSKGSIGFSSGLVTMGCTSASASGNIHGGTALAPDIASISSTTWVGCIGPGLINMAVTMGPSAWEFIGVSGETSAVTDTIVGYVDGVQATVTSTTPGVTCSFDVVGTADAELHEQVVKSAGPPPVYGQDLVINESSGNLRLANVVGCGGALADGDPANFSGTFNLHVTGASVPQPINVQ